MSEEISTKQMETTPEAGELTTLLQQEFPQAVTGFHVHRGDETVTIEKAVLEPVCRFLRDDSRCTFEIMMDLTAVDYLEQSKETRFEVVYHFKSLTHGHRLRLKVRLAEDECEIASIHHLWKAVDWYERECFDMFGINFVGHPNLKRILMYDEFDGHPLRKDYPIDKQQPLMELKEIDERYVYGRHA
ncbi:MAG: NADH-quinone oxidoreductase subunit C [SAR324 cluster bacterium]|nr:NADH-quinone oxidoreductase subunit C [SAR324 cluster bacterium]MBL7035054.1 NADH-quinone oxidoreductase subunit C [SAR324 cluster bacterium]